MRVIYHNRFVRRYAFGGKPSLDDWRGGPCQPGPRERYGPGNMPASSFAVWWPAIEGSHFSYIDYDDIGVIEVVG
jgi:hypothetical protein